MQATASQAMEDSGGSMPIGGQCRPLAPERRDTSRSRRTSHAQARIHTSGLPSRPSSTHNDNPHAPSPTTLSNGFAFPPSASAHLGPAARRTSVIRQRRSSPLLHEIQSPSRPFSTHQMLLLTPFGGPLPMEAITTNTGNGTGMGRMTRGSSSMGGPNPSSGSGRTASLGMSSTPSSIGMGRNDMPNSNSRVAQGLSSRFNARHQSLVQPVNPSPLSHPLTTIQSASDYGSESGSSSLAISREPSNSSQTDEDVEQEVQPHDGQSTARSRVNVMAIEMMRSNSLPVLTQRELDAMQDKDGELGIARGTHWAWVQDDDCDEVQHESPVPRTTPPSRPFAFQDPFAPLGTSAIQAGPSTARQMNPTSTSSDYHYSPTAEPRRMSEVNPTWPHDTTSPGSQTVIESRGTSIATITLSSPSPANNYPPLSPHSPPQMPAFNTRASMSALEPTLPLPITGLELPSAPIRPRILRYKTSPARFTGLGLHLVVKSQPSSSASGANTTTGSSGALSRRRSSTKSIGIDQIQDQDRRRSSGTSASSTESRRGTWAVVDVVDTLSSTSTVDLSRPSTSTSASTSISTSTSVYTTSTSSSNLRSSVPNIYTVEHVSSRSSPGSERYRSLPNRKGKLPSIAAGETIIPMPIGIFNDPLAFPRRGSLAVLSQTPLGPWAARHVADVTGTGMGTGVELLGAPKGNWQDRRGSWAEGWSKTQV